MIDRILKNTIVLDFETFFLKQRGGGGENYHLGCMTIPEYVKDPRFRIHCVAWATQNKSGVVWGDAVAGFVRSAADSYRICCYHNAFFDDFIMLNEKGVIPEKIIDTQQLAYHVIGARNEGGGGAGLKELSARFGLAVKKDLSFANGLHEIEGDNRRLLGEYALRDAENQFHLLSYLLPGVDCLPEELRAAQHTIRMFTSSDRWVRLDARGAEDFRESLARENSEFFVRNNIDMQRVGKAVFLQDFGAALERSGRKIPTKQGKNGQIPALAKKDLAMQEYLRDEDETVRTLAEARTRKDSWDAEDSRIGSLLSLARACKGYVPVQLRYFGAHTGRWSGSGGLNFQNLPRESGVRKLLVPREGYLFLIADFAQIEARVLAWLAEQENLLRVFRAGGDPYSEFASEAFGEPVRKPDTWDTEGSTKRLTGLRHVGKQCVLGMGYGAGVKTLCALFRGVPELDELFASGEMSDARVRELHRKYAEVYSGIPELWRRCQAMCTRAICTGRRVALSGGASVWAQTTEGDLHIHMPSGRRLRYEAASVDRVPAYPFEQIMYGRSFRKSLYGGKITENIVSGLARDILRDGILDLEKAGIRVLFHVHDEFVCEAREERAETEKKLLLGTIAPRGWYQQVPIALECSISGRYDK